MMMDRNEMIIVNEATLEASVNLDNAYGSFVSFRNSYECLDDLVNAVNSDKYGFWSEIEAIFRLVESAKLELDISRGEKTRLVQRYLEEAKERLAFFEKNIA